MYLIIILSILLISAILVLLVLNYKKSKGQTPSDQPWASLIRQFKSLAPKFKTARELEEYLLKINEEVKNYETNYAFLVEFNAVIRKVRERLRV
jgi:hypothetical protein